MSEIHTVCKPNIFQVNRPWWLSWFGRQSINSKVEGSDPGDAVSFSSNTQFKKKRDRLDKNATSIFGTFRSKSTSQAGALHVRACKNDLYMRRVCKNDLYMRRVSVQACAGQVNRVFRALLCMNVIHGCRRQASLYRPEMEQQGNLQYNSHMPRSDALALLTG